MKNDILQHLEAVKKAARKLAQLQDNEIRIILHHLADLTLANTAAILAANQLDLDRMDPADPKYDRLLLNEKRLADIAADLRKVAELPSPIGIELESRSLANGLHLQRITVPLGIVGVVFESRPNVTFDVFGICLKSGNATVLKGSRDAHDSNIAIAGLIKQALTPFGLEDACYLAPSEREALGYLLEATEYIDVIIPRGSQGLINYVRDHSKVPVIETGAGIVHVYFDASGDIGKGRAIITNSKARRVSVCNALDTLVIHRDRLTDLPELLQELDQKHHCIVYADDPSFEVLKNYYDAALLQPATEAHFGTEFLSMKLSVKTVDDLQEALDHIARYSSKHSETVVAEDPHVVETYLRSVDAAVVYANASTAFTDGGQFGLGAEIGISTQKLHARGPMALRELTSYKWIVKGDGQVREG